MRERVGRATRNAHLWLPGYLATRWRRRHEVPLRQVWLVIADHFEPLWQAPPLEVARERVARWRQGWPPIAARHADHDGRPPCYTFFYPEEEYRPELVEPLAELARAGIADVEIHLHHDGEGEANFVSRLQGFLEALSAGHGLLRSREGRPAFGFIHGDWALDNARPDGRFCGLDNELTLLGRLGCYADFTMPAAPNPSQAGPVNVVYRATDDPARPRSHGTGVPVTRGLPSVGDLTLIPGPLCLDFERGMRPRIDTGELAAHYRPSRRRAEAWLRAAPRIEDHAFVKLFAHGAQERHSKALLGGDLDHLFETLRAVCAEQQICLRFASPWEAWNAVEALRLGQDPLAPRRAGRSPIAGA